MCTLGAGRYGYVYACAHVGVVHEVSNKVMLYPGYMPAHPDPWPLVLHYGITYNIDDYAFDKHWHRSFQVTNCPSAYASCSEQYTAFVHNQASGDGATVQLWMPDDDFFFACRVARWLLRRFV